jgi:hypothetical protein
MGGPPVNYRFVNASIAGLAIWALAIGAEVVISIPWLRDRGSSLLVETVVWTVLGLTFACLPLFFSLTDVSLGPDALSWKRSKVAHWLFRTQPSEGGIRRSGIRAFRVDQNPWTGQTLTLLLHGGPSFEIPRGERNNEADNKFQAFVSAFRALANADPSHPIPELENIWRSPARRMMIGVVSAAAALAALSSLFLMKVSGGQIAVAGCAVWFSVLGLRFLLKRA